MDTEEPQTREVIRWTKEELRKVLGHHVIMTGGTSIGKKHVLAAQSCLPNDRKKDNPQFALFKKLNEMLAAGDYEKIIQGDRYESTSGLANVTRVVADLPAEPVELHHPVNLKAGETIRLEPLPMPVVPKREPTNDDAELLDRLIEINRQVIMLHATPVGTLVRMSHLQRGRIRNLAIQAADSISRFEQLLSV